MTQGNFTADEARTIEELRRRMKGRICEEMYQDDNLFMRFLRARNHNLDAAEDMLVKTFRSIFAVILPLVRSNPWDAQLTVPNDFRYAGLETHLGIEQAKKGMGSIHTNTIVITAEIEFGFASLKTTWFHSAAVQFPRARHHSKRRYWWVGVKGSTYNGRSDPKCPSTRREDTGVPNEGATCARMAADDAVGCTRAFLTMLWTSRRLDCQGHPGGGLRVNDISRIHWLPLRRNRRQYEQLTDFDRGRIIGLREAGWSNRRIGRHLGRSDMVVARCWQQWITEGRVYHRGGSGRPRNTNDREDRAIRRVATSAPTTSLASIQRHLPPSRHPVPSRETIRRRLTEVGLRSRRPLRRLPLTPHHRQCRLDFCRPRATWSVTDWRRVIFSDESRFSLSADDHRTRVWRRTGQRSDLAFIVERHTAISQGVTVW
ncbi:HTH_Tnp_Tc3_2 domain-containing protein [Trichonephila clavipes]|nr:HTH_Tnp_Tc3_2 domain-containing protein [Trichonephila clavipes]